MSTNRTKDPYAVEPRKLPSGRWKGRVVRYDPDTGKRRETSQTSLCRQNRHLAGIFPAWYDHANKRAEVVPSTLRYRTQSGSSSRVVQSKCPRTAIPTANQGRFLWFSVMIATSVANVTANVRPCHVTIASPPREWAAPERLYPPIIAKRSSEQDFSRIMANAFSGAM